MAATSHAKFGITKLAEPTISDVYETSAIATLRAQSQSLAERKLSIDRVLNQLELSDKLFLF